MANHIQLFSKGMNQDTQTTMRDTQEYFDALNVRLSARAGLSKEALEALRGTKEIFHIKEVPQVLLLSFVNQDVLASTSFILTVNGQSTQIVYNIPLEAQDSAVAYYEGIAELINSSGLAILAQASETGVIAYLDNFEGGDIAIDVDPPLILSEYAPKLTDIRILGSEKLRDTIIFLTTDTDNLGTGQIWELEYTPEGQASIRLIRHSMMNLSRDYPIEVKTRYETPALQKAYWTDFYNQVRSINTKSASSFFDTVEMAPIVRASQPKLVSINEAAGTLKEGYYQYCYRLTQQNGTQTMYSPSSGLVSITSKPLTADWEDYYSTNEGTSAKSITFKIDVYSQDFDQIEIVALYYKNATNVPEAKRVDVGELFGQSVYEFTHAGDQTTDLLVPNEELRILTNVMTRAKTIEIKDNKLFRGNLKDSFTTIDFKAEAYRYRTDGTIANGYNQTVDKINPYNSDITRAPISADQHKFRLDGILGGSGENVSFKFVTKELDITTRGAAEMLDAGLATVITSTTLSGPLTLNGEEYSSGGLWNSFKNPYIDYLYKGYQRGEVYRFGIVLFDLFGRPSEVKWVSDIRFPDHYDIPIFAPTHDGITGVKAQSLGIEFEVTLPDSIKDQITGYSIVRMERTKDNSTVLHQGPLSEIAERKDTGNEVYNAEETLYQFDGGSTWWTHFHPNLRSVDFPDLKVEEDFSFNADGMKITPCFSVRAGAVAYIDSDLGLISTFPGSEDKGIQLSYYLDPLYYQDSSETENLVSLSNTITKSQIQPKGWEYISSLLGSGRPYGHGVRIPVSNASLGNDIFLNVQGLGAETLLINLQDNQHNVSITGERVYSSDFFSNLGEGKIHPGRVDFWLAVASNNGILQLPVGQRRKLVVNLTRVLSSQYGGAKRSDRSQNTYISVNHYQPVFSTTPSTTTAEVFGGDVFICVYDQIKTAAANIQPLALDDLAVMAAQLVPLEMRYNLDLRTPSRYATLFALEGASGNPINGVIWGSVISVGTWTKRNDASRFFFSDPLDYQIRTEFDNRVDYSSTKSNGEQTDSWTQFKSEDYYDVDGDHGGVNKLITFNDTMFFFQNQAMGALLINPNVALASDIGSVYIGTGQTIQDAKYISTSTGTKHQWSVEAGLVGVYWYDSLAKNYMALTGQGATVVSDMIGMSSYFQGLDEALSNLDNPLKVGGFHTHYDFRRRDLYLTIIGKDESKTLVFDETRARFVSRDALVVPIYLGNRTSTISPKYDDGLKLHSHYEGRQGMFHDILYDWSVTMLMAPEALSTKVFDNIQFESDAINETGQFVTPLFKSVEYWNSFQHSGIVTLTPDDTLRKVEAEWKMPIYRNVVVETLNTPDLFDELNWDTTRTFKDRIRDKYVFMKLTYKNDGTLLRQLLKYVNMTFRISQR